VLRHQACMYVTLLHHQIRHNNLAAAQCVPHLSKSHDTSRKPSGHAGWSYVERDERKHTQQYADKPTHKHSCSLSKHPKGVTLLQYTYVPVQQTLRGQEWALEGSGFGYLSEQDQLFRQVPLEICSSKRLHTGYHASWGTGQLTCHV